ncbi:early nodulin-like protein 3 [Brassica napus]|uniref:early nodulin-like protein 3 n=1 Tax=Brassica napus TaxID=3708 RepID=UPI0020791658|nr:early nodulin-like protein 3 [Brassica napus]
MRAARRSGRLGCDRVSGLIASWTGSSELGRELRTSRIRDGLSEFLDELRTCLGFLASHDLHSSASPALQLSFCTTKIFIFDEGFKYKKDSVLVVSEDEYKECKATKPQLYSNNQDTVFKLDRPGLFYFISGVSGQCEKGQKMIIKVMETESSPDSPSPSSSFSSLSASTHKKSSALKTAVQFTSSSFVVLIVSVLVWH